MIKLRECEELLKQKGTKARLAMCTEAGIDFVFFYYLNLFSFSHDFLIKKRLESITLDVTIHHKTSIHGLTLGMVVFT